jgi:hypothetical protein
MTDFIYDYGDTVKVRDSSPAKFRPGEKGEVCGISVLPREASPDLPDDARTEDGSIVAYTVEFGDGSDELVPECYLLAAS